MRNYIIIYIRMKDKLLEKSLIYSMKIAKIKINFGRQNSIWYFYYFVFNINYDL